MKQFSDKIIHKINTEIETSCMDGDMSSNQALYMINFIRPLFEELREYIHRYNFQDNEEEIHFFKNIKPLILSKLIHYNDIYTLELRKPNGNKEAVKEHYKKKQVAIVDFCNNNLDFYQYYRSKATHLDKYYFLRGHENYKLCHNCGLLDKDPLFATCCDHRVAKMLAYDMLEIYLHQKVQDLERTEAIEISRASLPDNPFRWTGTKVAAIELGYAIYAAGVLNNGNTDIKEIMTYIEASFKVDLGDYYRTYLTMEEITTIYNKKFASKRLEQVRDLFIFSCYTALSYIDVCELTKDNIRISFDGNLWIMTKRHKTNVTSNVRLLEIPKAILEKYKDKLPNGMILPIISNQKVNNYLKEIASICGINKNLTFHVARHSCATSVLISNGVPIETVSKILGHTNIRTTQIYARITDVKVSNDMEMLAQKLDIAK